MKGLLVKISTFYFFIFISMNILEHYHRPRSSSEKSSASTEKSLALLSPQEREKLKQQSLEKLREIPSVIFTSLYEKLSKQKLPPRLSHADRVVFSPDQVRVATQQLNSLSLSKKKTSLSVLPTLRQILGPDEYDLYQTLSTYHKLVHKRYTSTPLLSNLQTTFMTLKQAHFKKKYKQTPAMRNLNPGNIKTEGDKGQDKNKYAIYSSLEQGRNALLRQLKRSQTGNSQVYRPDFTLNQFFERYAPDGKYIQYAQQAANMINSST